MNCGRSVRRRDGENHHPIVGWHGNSAAKLAKTNVWRTYQAIDLSKPDQIALYDDGVGTSSFKLFALLEQGATYEIEIGRPEGWMDADIPVPTTDGFASNAQAAPWYLALAVPMRRETGQNWFKPIAHVGEHARSEYVLDQKTQFVVKNRPGELFLFVNDAIIGVPGFWDHFYGNNLGDASVVIRKIGEAP